MICFKVFKLSSQCVFNIWNGYRRLIIAPNSKSWMDVFEISVRLLWFANTLINLLFYFSIERTIGFQPLKHLFYLYQFYYRLNLLLLFIDCLLTAHLKKKKEDRPQVNQICFESDLSEIFLVQWSPCLFWLPCSSSFWVPLKYTCSAKDMTFRVEKYDFDVAKISCLSLTEENWYGYSSGWFFSIRRSWDCSYFSIIIWTRLSN